MPVQDRTRIVFLLSIRLTRRPPRCILAFNRFQPSLLSHVMGTVSLPLELLIKIVEFALSDNEQEYTSSRTGSVPFWNVPKSGGFEKILSQDPGPHTPIPTAHSSTSGIGARVGETSKRGFIIDVGKASTSVAHTNSAMTTLRL
jgi:hypothetical protein